MTLTALILRYAGFAIVATLANLATQRLVLQFGQTGLSTYQTLEIDEIAHRLTYRAWGDDGEVVDSLIIDKLAADARESLVSERPTTRTR